MTNEHVHQTLERTFCITSDVAELSRVHSLTTELLGDANYGEDELHEILLAVQEGVTNAIHHGNGGTAECEVTIRLAVFDTHLEINIRDQGTGFDPGCIKDPLLPQHRLRSKGRGIMFIENFMDEVCFELNDQYHELKMVRFR